MSKLVAAAVAPLVLAGLVCGWLVTASWDRLPEQLATHWDGSGTPDGFTNVGSFLVTTASVGIMSWLLATVLAVALGPHLRSFTVFVAWLPGAVAGFTGALVLATVFANRDKLGTEADLSALAVNLPVLGLILGGALGAAIVGRPPGHETLESAHGPPLLETTLTWKGALWLAAILAVAGIVMVVVTKIVILLLLAPFILAFSQYHVSVDASAVNVSGGLFGWPSAHYPLDEIERAEVGEVRAFREWGGWGLRMRLDGSHGLITRSGPALVLHLNDGKRFVMTIDDPETVAAAITSALD